MASQQTPNYKLSRWAGTDRILVEEFNDNWDKIDTALKASADKAAAANGAGGGGKLRDQDAFLHRKRPIWHKQPHHRHISENARRLFPLRCRDLSGRPGRG